LPALFVPLVLKIQPVIKRENMNHNRNIFLGMILILTILTACSTFAAPATPTAVPSPTPAPTATPLPLYQQVKLTSVPAQETGASPDYKITTQTPSLTGSDDPRLKTFNDEMAAIVKSAVDDYRDKMKSFGPAPIQAQSTFDLKYEQTAPAGNIFSIKFTMEGYVAGMAHPYHVIRSANFDLEKGKDIALSDLFTANSDYLKTIANYCSDELSKRDIGFTDMFKQGADPTPDNYQEWNIASDGLVITFNEYQVAPYVSGPQTVTVPYSELKSLVDPKGPLAGFIQ